MARTQNKLTARQVATAKEGWHGDGSGLWLRVGKDRRAWVFIWKSDRRRELGLGSAAAVTLAAARERAQAARELIAAGGDPIALRLADRTAKAAPAARPLTFGEFTDEYVGSIVTGFRNAKHRHQWQQTLQTYAHCIRSVPIAHVSTEHVLDALIPIWTTKPETAKRVRERIERVLDAAKARGLRSPEALNPAAWRGHLAYLLPKRRKLIQGHHRALSFADVPRFMDELRVRNALAARALEFTVLTAARTGETLGATWSEIDFSKKTWTIPATRMKREVEHVVPLSAPALNLLREISSAEPDPVSFLFPSASGTQLSTEAMRAVTKRMKRTDTTIHGFRSSFSTWAGERTEFPRELIEMALSHAAGNAVELAYRRGTAVERRRPIMEMWAQFCSANSKD